MKRYILTIIICLSLVWVYAQNVAVLAGMKGDISVVREGKTIKIKNNDLLKNFDEIRSGEESFAAIRFIDNGATTKLFPNSVLIISAEKSGKNLNKHNNLAKGMIQSKVTPKSGQYVVETPNTVASVKGTDFITQYLLSRTTIGVIEGEVEIRNKISNRTVSSGEDEVYSSDDEGNIGEEEDDSFLENDENYQSDQSVPQQGNNLEIEIKKEDGTTKKVRIHYE